MLERLPLPQFKRVLDIACGRGRHAGRLADRGYVVTGIDRDENGLTIARRLAPRATFERLDMRAIDRLAGPFDGALILWQSFGYFSTAQNDQVLRSIFALLRPGGRLLLDVFHPDYFRSRQGRRDKVPPGVLAIEDRIDGNRLTSVITYADGSTELMDFEVFTPEQLTDRAASAGFHLLEACCWWDSARPPDPNQARYQLTLERAPA
ncbi:MAG: class I SAM-dependent methyltransferase [Candidatus Dormibacteraeota bacterium]|nr:class I SAM-dependent methyltransferase [Candidatus Dormibacteraeota bacterium]